MVLVSNLLLSVCSSGGQTAHYIHCEGIRPLCHTGPAVSRDSGTVNAAPQGDEGGRAEREGESQLALKSFS